VLLDFAYSKKMRRRRLLGLAVALAVIGVVAPASAVVSPATRAQPSPQCTSTHRVLPNDSWSRLAARFSVPQARLLRLNSASLATPLFVGDKVCIAVRTVSATSVPTSTTTTTTTTTTTIVPTSTTSTTTTTTTTTSVSLPVAPVLTVGALESCGRVSVSWSGASPDTGWYSVQWVPVSSGSYSFNSYTMFNVRGSSSVLPNWFAAGSTYAIRVFAMRADWDGLWHRTENVTPHSATVTFTVPSCIPATTTTVALTCATGGTCAVGDTGPGGGIVFYVHDDADDLFTSTGSDCGASCRYLEAAPNFWGNSSTADDACATPGTATDDPVCVWSGVTGTAIGATAQGTAVGTGYANTQAAVGQAGGGNTAGRAITAAWDYSNNGKTDWHLPSERELNELCKYAGSATTGNVAVDCFNAALRPGFGTLSTSFWSSSEFDATLTFSWQFDGVQGVSTKSGTGVRVRPVRAFGLPPG